MDRNRDAYAGPEVAESAAPEAPETDAEAPKIDAEELRRRLRYLGKLGRALGADKPGGCGAYAAVVGTALTGLGVPVRGVASTLPVYPDDVDQLRPAGPERYGVLGWTKRGAYFHHFGIEMELEDGRWLVDIGGVVPQTADARLPETPEYPLMRGHFELEEVQLMACDDRPNTWCPDFDRSLIPVLANLARAVIYSG